MIPLLTVEDVRKAEKDAIDAGTSESDLMRLAGTGIAEAVEAAFSGSPRSAVILCGPGKNGGDGLVIADQLAERGWSVSVWTFEREGVSGAPVSDSVTERVSWLSGDADVERVLPECDVVIDAVFGAGGRAELPAAVADVLARVMEARRRYPLTVWAVDLPSGTDADTGAMAEGALPADVTAMIGLPKVGAYRFPAASYTGRVRQIPIGLTHDEDLPESTPRLLGDDSARLSLPQRRAGLHKRSAGTVMVVGGAPNYYGAPRLCAEAALRSGAGLVSVAAPSSIIASIATAVPELTFHPLPVAEHGTAGDRMASIVRKQLPETNALVIGPGLGTDAPVPNFLSLLLGVSKSQRRGIGFGAFPDAEAVEPFDGTAVLDADALNWLSEQDNWWEALSGARLVLTPHPGELARLLNIDREKIEADPWQFAREAAEKFKQVVVLKHGHSTVATPDGRILVAPQAPPSLATAGTGDVLAGIIGGLLGQGLEPEEAAASGLVVGLRATELAEQRIGRVGMLASDIIACLPGALDRIAGGQSTD